MNISKKTKTLLCIALALILAGLCTALLTVVLAYAVLWLMDALFMKRFVKCFF